VDATEEPLCGPRYGRLVNHGTKREVNAKMKVLEVNGVPTLCLFASKMISAGDEILYDYGVKVPWESQVKNLFGLRREIREKVNDALLLSLLVFCSMYSLHFCCFIYSEAL